MMAFSKLSAKTKLSFIIQITLKNVFRSAWVKAAYYCLMENKQWAVQRLTSVDSDCHAEPGKCAFKTVMDESQLLLFGLICLELVISIWIQWMYWYVSVVEQKYALSLLPLFLDNPLEMLM